jgi:hypothetical protein
MSAVDMAEKFARLVRERCSAPVQEAALSALADLRRPDDIKGRTGLFAALGENGH